MVKRKTFFREREYRRFKSFNKEKEALKCQKELYNIMIREVYPRRFPPLLHHQPAQSLMGRRLVRDKFVVYIPTSWSVTE